MLVLSNGEYVVVEFVQHEILESPVKVYNFEVEDYHTYFVGEVSVLVHNGCEDEVPPTIKNWKDETVTIPKGHIMSPRDPDFSVKPIVEAGPYTTTQRNQFLAGTSAGTKLAPHHRHQIPVRDGGIIDEIPGPGHPNGNQHTAGTPSRHPSTSIFNSETGGNALRTQEIRTHWTEKGKRLIEVRPGEWVDPGF